MTLAEAERRAVAAVDDLAEEMVTFARDLVRIPTVNPPGEGYAECAEFVGERLKRFGYRVDIIDADGLPEHTERYPRRNVVGRLAGAGSGPTLHFNGHYDVVPAGNDWSIDPFGGEIRDGRLYGRGTCDQKAGIAASIFAVEAIRRAGIRLDGTVEQSATVDEESGGFAGVAWLCDKGLIRKGRQDFVVITEPLDPERVCVGHRGVYWLEVTTLGSTGHGSMPGLGVNAADSMARLLVAVDRQLRPRLAQRTTLQPVEPPGARQPSITTNAIHAGQPLGVWQSPCVPDRCAVVLDRRYLAEEEFEDVRAEIVELLDEMASADSTFRYEIRDMVHVDPMVGDPDGLLPTTTAGTIRDVLGVEPKLIHSPGTYDQKHVVRRGGIDQCIAYGPGRLVLAHRPDEYVAIDDLLASARVMAVLALRLVGPPRP